MTTKKSQQETAIVEAKQPKEVKETPANQTFMPVIFEGEKSTFPVSAIHDVKIARPIEIEGESFVAITMGDSIYYVRPVIFQRYVLDKQLTPEDANRVREDVKKNVEDVKRAWVQLGTAVLSVHTPRLYLAWGYKTFNEYCEKELKVHFSTIYQVMTSTLFLMRDQPEIYQSLMDGEKKVTDALPSYHAIYLLEKKRKRLDKNKYEGLRKQLFEHGLSTRDLAKKLHEILGEGKAKPSPKISLTALVKSYTVLCKQMQQLRVGQDVLKEARDVLEKLKKMEGEKE